jgi:hypothetical protein
LHGAVAEPLDAAGAEIEGAGSVDKGHDDSPLVGRSIQSAACAKEKAARGRGHFVYCRGAAAYQIFTR